MVRWLASLAFVTLAIGCGPEQAAVERSIDQQKRDLIRQAEKAISEMQPLLGLYHGQWTSPNGSQYPVSMEIFVGKQLKVIPPRNEVVEVPSLTGSIFISDDDPRKNLMGMGEILAGRFNARTGQLSLSLGPAPGGRSGGEGDREFNGRVEGDSITGRFPVNGRWSDIAVRRVLTR